MALTHIVRTGDYHDDMDRIQNALFEVMEASFDAAGEMTSAQRADIQDEARECIDRVLESAFEEHVRQIGDAVLDYVKGSLVEEIVPAIVTALSTTVAA